MSDRLDLFAVELIWDDGDSKETVCFATSEKNANMLKEVLTRALTTDVTFAAAARIVSGQAEKIAFDVVHQEIVASVDLDIRDYD